MLIHIVDDNKDIAITTDGKGWTITEQTSEGIRISHLKNEKDMISKKED